jgi:hypothetical protein
MIIYEERLENSRENNGTKYTQASGIIDYIRVTINYMFCSAARKERNLQTSAH